MLNSHLRIKELSFLIRRLWIPIWCCIQHTNRNIILYRYIISPKFQTIKWWTTENMHMHQSTQFSQTECVLCIKPALMWRFSRGVWRRYRCPSTCGYTTCPTCAPLKWRTRISFGRNSRGRLERAGWNSVPIVSGTLTSDGRRMVNGYSSLRPFTIVYWPRPHRLMRHTSKSKCN